MKIALVYPKRELLVQSLAQQQNQQTLCKGTGRNGLQHLSRFAPFILGYIWLFLSRVLSPCFLFTRISIGTTLPSRLSGSHGIAGTQVIFVLSRKRGMLK